jgi:hypothetical protein
LNEQKRKNKGVIERFNEMKTNPIELVKKQTFYNSKNKSLRNIYTVETTTNFR